MMRANLAWVMLLLLGLSSGSALAQGGLRDDLDAFRKLPLWQPEPMGFSENYVVDYRNKLPPPGTQKMNDCNSWAFAYAAKSFDEANDQDWRPDAPSRIFSPRWIYNQINQGVDKGSSGLNAINLLKEKGCATLATCPYVPGDFRGQPTAAAIEEAKLFKIRNVYGVNSKETIRTALSQGHIVPIGVSTNPVFMGGRWEVYNTTLHNSGKALRRPGQEHGLHALCIVGCDDARQAFLVMNSWGTAWGKGGFFWLDYALANRFAEDERSDAFMLWAVVLVDDRDKVAVGSDGKYRSTRPNLELAWPLGNVHYRGFNEKTHKQDYFFSALMIGASDVLNLIQKVDWVCGADGDKPFKLSSVNRDDNFRITGTMPRNEFTVAGTVTFKDGKTKDVKLAYKAEKPSGEHRRLELVFKESYFGKLSVEGKPTSAWSWNVELGGNLTDLKDVTNVVWNVGELSRQTPTLEQTKTSIRLGKGHFGHSGTATWPGLITADVTFNDGSTKRLRHLTVFESPADDSVSLKSEYREEEGRDGKTWYNVTIELQAPQSQALFGIDRIEYDFGPTFDGYRRVADWSSLKYAVSCATQKEFRIKAKVHFTNGTVQDISHWVELGKEAKYADARRIEIQTQAVYLGAIDKPSWRVVLRPNGDSDTLDQVDKVVYTLPRSVWPGGKQEIATNDQADHRFAFSVGQPFEGSAQVIFKNGNFTRLPFTLAELPPRLDRLQLAVETRTIKTAAKSETRMWKAWIAGPELSVQRVVQVEYNYRVHGRWQRTVVDPSHKEVPAFLACNGIVTEPTPLRAALTLNDGSRMFLYNEIEDGEQTWVDQIGGLDIQMQEKFLGIEEGKPTWRLLAELIGPPEALSRVKTLTFVRWSDKQNFKVLPLDGIWRTNIHVTRPDDFVAHILMNDGSEEKTAIMTTSLAGRTSAPLILRQANGGLPGQQDGQANQLVRVYLDGWDNELRNVKNVQYSLPPSFNPRNPIVPLRAFGLYRGFSRSIRVSEPIGVDAVANMVDGTKRELSIQAGLPSRPLGWDHGVRYFGKTTDGDPQWLVDFWLTGDSAQLADLTSADYFTKSLTTLFRGERRATWGPRFQHQAIAGRDFDMESVTIRKNDGTAEKLRGGAVKLKVKPLDEFDIRVAAGMTWTGQKPEQREWVFHIAGPEQLMEQVDHVVWRLTDGSDYPQSIAWRHGERFDGFEMRAQGEGSPGVQVVIHMLDKKEITLSRKATEAGKSTR